MLIEHQTSLSLLSEKLFVFTLFSLLSPPFRSFTNIFICLSLEGKTDYYARKRLIAQDKNKYNSPKYRLVVRITNKDVVCQIVFARIQGDFVLTSAYSHELKSYGISVGLTNYAAAYATGLLCARRALTKLGLASQYEGQKEANGEFFEVEALEEGPRPFKAFLDTGLARTSTGAKVFAAMKGAADGGIYVPHSESRFPGFDAEKESLDAAVLRKYIFGGHVAEYMRHLKEEDPERYQKQFSQYIKAGIDADKIEAVYQKAHAAIRKDPTHKPTQKKESYPPSQFKKARLNLKQRKDKVKQKKAAFEAKLIAGAQE